MVTLIIIIKMTIITKKTTEVYNLDAYDYI